MDSSNMGVVTTGDIEAQQHNLDWFINRKFMLRPNQEGEVNKLGYVILKVPEYRRQPPQAFSPVGWRFGLHNRENLDNNGSEAIKLGIAIQYGLVGEKWDHFCDKIVDDSMAMLACYGLQKGGTNWTDEQIKNVLALDALFLATIIDIWFPENERRLWTPNTLPSPFIENDVFYSRFNMWIDSLHHDLYRVENQIPFVLIDKVVEYIHNFVVPHTSEGNEHLIDDLQYYQQRSVEFAVNGSASDFMITSGEAFKIDNVSPFGEKTHILGATYNAICGSEGLFLKSMLGRTYIYIPSATMLKQSGIKIVGVDGPLYKMSYNKNCLSLPKMRVYDETFSFIRNMAWYECNTITGSCLFSDYILLMCDLIQAPEDLDLLTKHGVINNACGTIKGFEMWMALQEGLMQIPSSEEHHVRKVAIVNRCGR